MTKADIALAIVPQSDGEEKARPVLLIGRLPGYGDWLVLGISFQIEIVGSDPRRCRSTYWEVASKRAAQYTPLQGGNDSFGLMEM